MSPWYIVPYSFKVHFKFINIHVVIYLHFVAYLFSWVFFFQLTALLYFYLHLSFNFQLSNSQWASISSSYLDPRIVCIQSASCVFVVRYLGVSKHAIWLVEPHTPSSYLRRIDSRGISPWMKQCQVMFWRCARKRN